MHCDILVVGAGPAGSSAASEAAKLGAEVIMVERKKNIGDPVQCAEFIPKPLWGKMDISRRCIVQETKGMKVYLSGKELQVWNSPGYMLDRPVMERDLALKAEKKGVKIISNTNCSKRKERKVIIKSKGKEKEVETEVIIGADGPKSTVGKWMDEENRDFIIGAQFEVPLVKGFDMTEVYFDTNFRGGYAWLFPKGHTANMGIGIRSEPMPGKKMQLHDLLVKFKNGLAAEGKIKQQVISKTSGLIPVGGALTTVKKNMMLVGDAAGQTHPITGSGIPQAVVCGKIAGRAGAQAVNEDDIEILYDYEKQWKNIFEDELERAKRRRRLLESQWDDLSGVLRRCWVTFGEYYE